RDGKFMVRHQSIELSVTFNLVDVLAQGFALFSANVVNVVEDAFEAAVFFQPACSEAGANARNTGQVISALPHQGREFRILQWCVTVASHDRIGRKRW